MARVYRPFGKPLLRDDDGRVLAQSCRQCGHFALDTETGLCAGCNLHGGLESTLRMLQNGYTAMVKESH